MTQPRAATPGLDELPAIAGFRQRGMDMTRLETFVDAAFAFAVTLLVVGGGDSIPLSFDEMLQAIKQVPAFAASFANIMVFWYAHHVWSRRFGLDDSRSVVLSLALIFVVLVYVYPLKAIYSGAIGFFTAGYLPSYFDLETIGDLRDLFVIFGSGYALLSLLVVLLNNHALACADRLHLNELERYDTVSERGHWIVNTAVPLLSIVLALTLPDRWVVGAGLIYFLFAVAVPWYAVRRGKGRPA
jgi:uncharacterized membrane protein